MTTEATETEPVETETPTPVVRRRSMLAMFAAITGVLVALVAVDVEVGLSHGKYSVPTSLFTVRSCATKIAETSLQGHHTPVHDHSYPFADVGMDNRSSHSKTYTVTVTFRNARTGLRLGTGTSTLAFPPNSTASHDYQRIMSKQGPFDTSVANNVNCRVTSAR
jgi:hypothetical protein